jgi:pilus assembly protein Flp/PilA
MGMLKKIVHFARQDDGVTAVEYAVLAVLIIAALVLAMTGFSGSLTNAFTQIGTKVSGAQLGSN